MQNVLRKKINLLLVLLVFSSLAWAAAVPWKGKPYGQWDDKDIQRVFTDSPWARKATVTRTWPAVSQEEAQNPQLPGSGKSMSAAQGSNEASASELEVHVYWVSSRLLRHASACR